jgi:hypothetical protein
MVAKRPLNTPRLSKISRIFPWYILGYFPPTDSYVAFANCKTR